jgi:hypothetical protein
MNILDAAAPGSAASSSPTNPGLVAKLALRLDDLIVQKV